MSRSIGEVNHGFPADSRHSRCALVLHGATAPCPSLLKLRGAQNSFSKESPAAGTRCRRLAVRAMTGSWCRVGSTGSRAGCLTTARSRRPRMRTWSLSASWLGTTSPWPSSFGCTGHVSGVPMSVGSLGKERRLLVALSSRIGLCCALVGTYLCGVSTQPTA